MVLSLIRELYNQGWAEDCYALATAHGVLGLAKLNNMDTHTNGVQAPTSLSLSLSAAPSAFLFTPVQGHKMNAIKRVW